jgi:hypothetical protein
VPHRLPPIVTPPLSRFREWVQLLPKYQAQSLELLQPPVLRTLACAASTLLADMPAHNSAPLCSPRKCSCALTLGLAL